MFRPFLDKYLEWFYSFSAGILVPSRHTLNKLFNKGYRNLEIWSRGINTACFNPEFRNMELRDRFGKDKFIVLYVGRLSREKNLDMLLHAAAVIENCFPAQTMFVFTGDGPYAEIVQDCGLSNVLCTGFRRGRELSEIYASADCFAFPSGTETFGNVVLEAMASGLPVAGVASGGVMDFLSHNHNALLCAAGDADAFTNNLVSFMADENLRLRLAENARQDTQTRDWNHIFDGLIAAYNSVINEKQQAFFKLSA